MSTINFRLIKQLWMFLAVAEELHFGRAATRLGMSQPPLTEQIKILENALKLMLFERSRRGTKLTPAGAAILPAVKQFANDMETLDKTVREIVRGQTGVLQVGAITSAMLETIPPLLDKLNQKYPDVTVYVKEIDSVEAIPALENGELDIAFVRLDGETKSGIETLSLAKDRLAVAMPKTHHLAQKPKIAIAELEPEQMVMSSRQVSPSYFDMLVAACRKYGFSPRILHEVRSVTSQIAYVSCGQGVALVPDGVAKLAPNNVIVKPLVEDIAVITSAMTWNSQRHHPMLKVVRDLLSS
ncbi:MAG: LysR substrate-binding domain-containing protein [Enterobacterales bacterium]|nr:LysR substrate-binding domain-containing protein [Enterobacterales bacterium]